MWLVFVRNVKFSAAECNSFNIRKKNVRYLASKQIIEGSSVKKQPSRSKVASFGVQSYNLQDTIPIFFDFNLKYILSINGGFLIGNICAIHHIMPCSPSEIQYTKTA